MALRVRAPEVLFDSDEAWVRAVAAVGWDAVYARHVAALSWADVALLEYPLQGLNPLTVPLFGAAGLVCSPELSLDDIGRLRRRPVTGSPTPARRRNADAARCARRSSRRSSLGASRCS